MINHIYARFSGKPKPGDAYAQESGARSLLKKFDRTVVHVASFQGIDVDFNPIYAAVDDLERKLGALDVVYLRPSDSALSNVILDSIHSVRVHGGGGTGGKECSMQDFNTLDELWDALNPQNPQRLKRKEAIIQQKIAELSAEQAEYMALAAKLAEEIKQEEMKRMKLREDA